MWRLARAAVAWAPAHAAGTAAQAAAARAAGQAGPLAAAQLAHASDVRPGRDRAVTLTLNPIAGAAPLRATGADRAGRARPAARTRPARARSARRPRPRARLPPGRPAPRSPTPPRACAAPRERAQAPRGRGGRGRAARHGGQRSAGTHAPWRHRVSITPRGRGLVEYIVHSHQPAKVTHGGLRLPAKAPADLPPKTSTMQKALPDRRSLSHLQQRLRAPPAPPGFPPMARHGLTSLTTRSGSHLAQVACCFIHALVFHTHVGARRLDASRAALSGVGRAARAAPPGATCRPPPAAPPPPRAPPPARAPARGRTPARPPPTRPGPRPARRPPARPRRPGHPAQGWARNGRAGCRPRAAAHGWRPQPPRPGRRPPAAPARPRRCDYPTLTLCRPRRDRVGAHQLHLRAPPPPVARPRLGAACAATARPR